MTADIQMQRNELPTDLRSIEARARRLAWWTIAYLASAGVFLYAVVGSSQAMKAAWLETVFSIATPALYLVAARVSRRPGDRRFPYGYYRWVSIAFLCAALALFGLGAYLVIDAGSKLIKGSETEIGSIPLFGTALWLGWPMLGALAWSALPAWLIGRAQMPRARELHDKLLSTDAKMRRADWLTSAAAATGILGIAADQTWVDPVAGGIIGFSVLWSGARQLWHAAADLADSAPTTLDGRWDTLPDRVAERLRGLDWVSDAEVRLREEGRLIFGQGFVVPRSDEHLTERAAAAVEKVRRLDWRIQSFVIIPVPGIEVTDVADVRRSRRKNRNLPRPDGKGKPHPSASTG